MLYTIHSLSRLLGSVILAAAVLLAPWVYRSAMPFPGTLIYGLVLGSSIAAFLSVLTLPRRLRQGESVKRLLPASLLILAGIGLGFLQTVPLSESAVSSLSPEIIHKSENLLPLPNTEEGQLEGNLLAEGADSLSAVWKEKGYWPSTLSVCTRDTRDRLADLIWGFMGFVSAGILFQTRKERFRLWYLTAINGCLLALMVILLKTVGEFPGYRKFWPEAVIAVSMNKNGLAGYLTMCLAPGMGLFLRSVLLAIRRRESEEIYYEGVRYRNHSLLIRFINGISDFFLLFSGDIIFRLAAIVLLLAGAALTLSRGGTLAGLFTFLTAALLFSVRRRSGIFLIPVWGGLIAVFLLLIFLGVSEPVQDRMETLLDTEEHQSEVIANSRLGNWSSAFETARSYHWRGTGLGTYALANRANDKALHFNRYFKYAENHAVETLLDSGIAGLSLLFGEIILFWFFVLRGLRSGRDLHLYRTGDEEDAESAECVQTAADDVFILSLGTASLLTGLMVSASFDFGLFSYPNMLLAAILFGSFAGGSLTLHAEEQPSLPLDRRSGQFPFFYLFSALTLTAAASVLGFFGYRTTHHYELAQQVSHQLSAPVDQKDQTADYFTSLIDQYSRVLTLRPDDPYLHLELAQVYVGRFQQLYWEQLSREFTDTDPQELRIQASVESAFFALQPYFKAKMTVIPRRFRNDPIVSGNLLPALREIWIARRLSPLYPQPHISGVFLAPLVLELGDIEGFIDTSVRRITVISVNEPRTLFSSGLIHYLSGKREQAVEEWRRSAALSNDRIVEITRVLAAEPKKADFRRHLGAVLGGDWNKAESALSLFSREEDPIIYSVYLELMQMILNADKEKDSADWYRNSARYCVLAGQTEKADLYYKKALEKDGFNADWHFEYGRFLFQNGRKGEAVDELSRAVELNPKAKVFRKVLKDIHPE